MAMTLEQQRAIAIAEAELKLRQGPSLTAGEVATQAVQNLPSSFGNLVTDLYTAITNPIQTAKSVLDLGAGILQNVLPENVVQAIGEDKASREVANQVGQFYVDRYGSVEGAKKAIAQDPAGVLADASTLLFTGGSLTPGRVGTQISRAGAVIDPLAIAARTTAATARGAGKVAAPVLGMTTGAGGEAISQAYQAGRAGGERATQFRENIAGRAEATSILDAAKSNLEVIKQDRSATYRSGMVDISKDKSVLAFNNIDKALADAEAKTRYRGQIKNQEAFDAVQKAKEEIANWKKLDPVEYHTPEGFDALKQKVGAILENLDPAKSPYGAVNSIYNSVKSEIVRQAPVYANTMRQYTQATDQIREIEKTLSLNRNASVDTAMRKLQSLMRDNVQTNYGQRVKLAQELERVGGKPMMPGLAGQSLQSLTPRGLSQITGGGLPVLAALGGNVPQAVGMAAVSSPRLMGEAAYGTGVARRMAGQATQQAPFIVNPQLYNYLLQSGNIQGLLE